MQDVIRNVLLAAPYKQEETSRGSHKTAQLSPKPRGNRARRTPLARSRHQQQSRTRGRRVSHGGNAGKDARAYTPCGQVKCMEYSIAKGTWCVRALAGEATTRSGTKLDSIEVVFRGLHGHHAFRDDVELNVFEHIEISMCPVVDY